jgi:hypothetical protein
VRSESIPGGGRQGVDWRRAEFILTLLAVVGFITVPIRITTIYSGLPAHSHAAHILAYVYVVFTATRIVTFAAGRISGGAPTGLGIVDRLLSPKPVFTSLRVALVVLSIGAG